MTKDNNAPQSEATRANLLTRSFHICMPRWGAWAIMLGLIAFVVFMSTRQYVELREEWAATDRPAILTLESMKKILQLKEERALSTDFVSFVEDSAKFALPLTAKNSPSRAATLNDLARIYAARGEYDKAIPMFKQSKRLLTEYLGAEHEDVVIIEGNISTALADQLKAANTE